MSEQTKGRADLYQRVTDRIIEQLEAGTVPWVQPWKAGATPRHAALPHNAVSGRSYSGAGSLRIAARIFAALAIAILLGTWGGLVGALFALGLVALAVGYLGELLALAIGRRRG